MSCLKSGNHYCSWHTGRWKFSPYKHLNIVKVLQPIHVWINDHDELLITMNKLRFLNQMFYMTYVDDVAKSWQLYINWI